MPFQRPQSLADIPAFRVGGIPFGIAIREFLDTFKALSPAARPAALASCPALLHGRVPDGAMNDAYLAAVAEKLARDHHLGPPPEWVFAPERFLANPWFAAAAFPGLRPLLLMESPVSLSPAESLYQRERAGAGLEGHFWVFANAHGSPRCASTF